MNSSLSDFANLGKYIQEYRRRLQIMVEWRIDPRLRVRVSADDILQDAFKRAHQKWPDFLRRASQGDATPSETAYQPMETEIGSAITAIYGLPVYLWLRQQVSDALIEAWRKHSREPRDIRKDMPLPDSSALHLGFGLLGREPSPVSAIRRVEICELVRDAIRQLKEVDREVLLMRMTEEMSHKEIADALNITIDAACARYARALERFRKVWNKRHPDFGSLP